MKTLEDIKRDGWESGINQVWNADCLEAMKLLPDKCVDFIWTDPPYNVGKDYGAYKDKLSDEDYLKWMAEVIRECKRVSRNGIAIMTPQKYMLELWSILGPEFRQIVLSYGPEGAIRFGFVNQFTSILVNRKPIGYVKNVWHNLQMPGLGWFFREESFGNPGYTSEDITGRIIGSFTQGGEIILDPFMGTGTTARMAKNLKRDFIGVEIDPDYIKIAESRLKQEILL